MPYVYRKGDVIAALHTKLTSHLLALGIDPGGAVEGDLVRDFLPHMARRLHAAATVKLGFAADVDWAALRQLNPDLIWADARNASGEKLQALRKMAPVIVTDLAQGDWKEQLADMGALASREREAAAFLQAYEAKRLRMKALLHNKLGKRTCCAAFRIVGQELRVMGPGKPLGRMMYGELGMRPAAAVAAMGEGPYQVIEPAQLARYEDADVIGIMVFDDDKSRAFFNILLQHPAWNALGAVRNSKVYILNGQAWLDYSSIGQDAALNDIGNLFA